MLHTHSPPNLGRLVQSRLAALAKAASMPAVPFTPDPDVEPGLWPRVASERDDRLAACLRQEGLVAPPRLGSDDPARPQS